MNLVGGGGGVCVDATSLVVRHCLVVTMEANVCKCRSIQSLAGTSIKKALPKNVYQSLFYTTRARECERQGTHKT